MGPPVGILINLFGVNTMNKATALIAAGALAVSASAAFAGGNAAPIIEDEPIVIVEPGSSIGSLPLALIGLVIVGVAIAAGGGSNESE